MSRLSPSLNIFLMQFEPEQFVDGLLGIGGAGGKSGTKNEGAMLAARLVDMRKERDERAKVVGKDSVSEPDSLIASAAPSRNLLPDELVSEPSNTGTSNRPNRSNKKKKKKKRR